MKPIFLLFLNWPLYKLKFLIPLVNFAPKWYYSSYAYATCAVCFSCNLAIFMSVLSHHCNCYTVEAFEPHNSAYSLTHSLSIVYHTVYLYTDSDSSVIEIMVYWSLNFFDLFRVLERSQELLTWSGNFLHFMKPNVFKILPQIPHA